MRALSPSTRSRIWTAAVVTHFFGMYRSVMLPSAISAAKNTVSDSVGCGVDGEPDVLGVGAHLQRQHSLGDQLAGVGADDGGAQQPPRALVEDQLGHAFVARQSRARDRWRPRGTRLSRSRVPCALAMVSVRPIQATSGSV